MQMRVLEVRVLGVERAPGSYRKASWLLVGNGGRGGGGGEAGSNTDAV